MATDRSPAVRRAIRCVAFCALLWLPLLLFELGSPYPWNEIAATSELRLLFALSTAVWVALITALSLGTLVVRAAVHVRGGADAVLDLAAVTLASGLLLETHSRAAGLLGAAGAPPEASLAATALASGAAAAVGVAVWAVAWPSRLRSRGATALALVALACWGGLVARSFEWMTPWRGGMLLASLASLVLLLRLAGRRPGAAEAPRVGVGGALWVGFLGVAVPLAIASVGFRATRYPVSATEPPPRPVNVVLVVIDTLRADHTSFGGYPLPTTPMLAERLRGGSTVFSRGSSMSSATVPSVAGLFTSRFSEEKQKDEEAPWTMARAFADAGYETAALISNGVLNRPFFHEGFHEMSVFGPYTYFMESFFLFDLMTGHDRWTGLRRLRSLGLHKVPAPTVRDRARRWLAREHERPFFLYVHFMDPHWPYYEHGLGLVPESVRGIDDPYSYVDLLQRDEKFRPDPDRLREMIARYDEEVRRVDESVAAILDDVDAIDPDGSTLVIIAADHGEEFFEHGGFSHGHDVYEEQVHVPLIFRWSGTGGPGARVARVDAPVSLADVFPTLIDYFALPSPPEPLLGRSLRPLIEGAREDRWHPVHSWAGYENARSYREGRWKVRIGNDEAVAIYDLAADPGEQSPLAADVAERRELAERARRFLPAVAGTDGAAGTEAGGEAEETLDDPALEHLRALGYIK